MSQNTIVHANHLHYTYPGGEEKKPALEEICFELQEGEELALLGRNGSGKSTLAKLLSCLEFPTKGEVMVCGIPAVDEEAIWEIRRICAMVFQNPDNQIVGTTVEEDIAFGPENLGLPSAEIIARVQQAAQRVGLGDRLEFPPSALSGGQKQKLALAGVLALKPRVLILDESTSMLDPLSRREVLDLVEDLRKKDGLTVLNITHHMEEALAADRLIVLDRGRAVLEGSPEKLFAEAEWIQSLGLDIPFHSSVVLALARLFQLPYDKEKAVFWEGALEELRRILREIQKLPRAELERACAQCSNLHTASFVEDEVLLQVQNLSYRYPNQPKESPDALSGINFSIKKGEIFGIMGHTGSGKSTLIQHMNGLIRCSKDEVKVLGHCAHSNQDILALRKHVGLLFQYPEHQLFAETVEEDVAYGPRKMGMNEEEIKISVQRAVQWVGLEESLLKKSPFELSGGQKRRAALAGVLALNPSILVLDEPAAALDPVGREEMLRLIENLRKQGTTVVLVSHAMEDLARVCDHILVLEAGQQVAYGTPAEVFNQAPERLQEQRIEVPASVKLLRALGFTQQIFRLDELLAFLLKDLLKKQEESRPLEPNLGKGGTV